MPAIETPSAIMDFFNRYQDQNRVHTKSLISTLFGDLVVPQGGKIWVKTISKLLEPLGINNRLVRTSLFRLSEEGWLQSTKSGRNSYYQLTNVADSQTRLAEKLIYYPHEKQWDGLWTLVFLVMDFDESARQQLEQELNWLGFGLVAKYVWAHPCVAVEQVAERARKLDLVDKVICMRCQNSYQPEIGLAVEDQLMASRCLPLAEVESEYQHFIDAFKSLIVDGVPKLRECPEKDQLALRLVLLDAYRRIILRDPHLPGALLPDNWVGNKAYELCRNIYQHIAPGADRYYRELILLAEPSLLGSQKHCFAKRFNLSSIDDCTA